MAKKEFPIYSNQELRQLEKELDKYLVKSRLSNGDVVEFCDYVQYFIAENAMSDRTTVRDIQKYEMIQNKLMQLKKLEARTKYAKEKELEHYQNSN